MNREDIKSNLEFKATIRSIMKRYPFIVGYELPKTFEEDWRLFSNILPIRFIISMKKLKEVFPDWEPMFYVEKSIESDGEYISVYLGSAFDTTNNEGPRKVEDDIVDISRRVMSSSVIPKDKKMGRAVMGSAFVILP